MQTPDYTALSWLWSQIDATFVQFLTMFISYKLMLFPFVLAFIYGLYKVFKRFFKKGG